MADIDFAAIVKEDAATAPGGVQQPAQVDATAEATAAPGEDAPATEEQDAEPSQAGGKKPIGPRIAQLTAQRREAERRAERAERLLEQSLAGRAPQPQTQVADGEPHESQFATYGEYQRALIRHEAKKIAAETVQQTETQRSRVAEVETTKQRGQTFWADTAKEARAAKIEGYEEAAAAIQSGEVPTTPVISDFMLEVAKNKAALIAWLGSNPDEAERIASLRPVQAVAELTRKDAALGTPARTTRAPAPPPGIAGGAAAPASIERMSHDQLREWAAKQQRR